MEEQGERTNLKRRCRLQSSRWLSKAWKLGAIANLALLQGPETHLTWKQGGRQ